MSGIVSAGDASEEAAAGAPGDAGGGEFWHLTSGECSSNKLAVTSTCTNNFPHLLHDMADLL
jgi:hypothetical protein